MTALGGFRTFPPIVMKRIIIWHYVLITVLYFLSADERLSSKKNSPRIAAQAAFLYHPARQIFKIS